jgi:carboxylate-amine ligase
MRLLWRLKRMNVTWRRYKSLLINENRWRAMRYGFDAGLIDFGKREMTDYGELLDELLDMIREDAEHFGCVQQIARARDILLLGTSAHRQSAIYNGAIAAGATEQEALFQVIDWLIDRTRQNTEAEDGEPAG